MIKYYISSHCICVLLCLLYLLPCLFTFKYINSFSIRNYKNSRQTMQLQMKDKSSANIMTLSRFMIEATRANTDHADLDGLILSIELACKTISNLIARSSMEDLTGIQSLETESSIYKLADNILKNSLRFSGKLGVLAGENEEHQHPILELWNSKYITVFDPLDGSLNIDIGIATGTMFTIYKEPEECLLDYGENVSGATKERLLNAFKSSSNIVGAGYCMYSSTTTLMFSIGNGLHGFTLDQSVGEFVLTHPNIEIPAYGSIYSINEGYSYKFSQSQLQKYLDRIKSGKGKNEKEYSLRYIGSFVADIHRTLLYGGIFIYPSTFINPNGKLKLIHEVRPMAYLIEQAGGKASNGFERLLDIEIISLDQSTPVFMGSMKDVEEVEEILSNN